ncbi:MAG: hypothetical protein V1850_03195 [Candidatus Bathyarchaeota archaeon]
MSEDKLKDFLKTGKDWSNLKTSIPGVFVLKLPAYKSSPTRLAVELNPVDNNGSPKKRRGLIMRTGVDLDDFEKLFQHETLSKLLSMIESVNPKAEVARRKGEEVLEL